MEAGKYYIQGLDEYIRQGEPQQRERSEAWKVAIGLQQVDRLQTSEYLLDTAKRHIEGDISIDEAKQLIDSYYKSESGRKAVENSRTEEADKVAARITELIEEKTFSFTPAQLISIHRRLFDGIYMLAGRIRDYNITKSEWVLGGKTVYYASADAISETLDYDMRQEREFNYANLNIDDAIRHLTRFCANLWQVHAFCEGNTRTTAVFMIKYLRTLGFNVVNDVFTENSWYFRNALVRANYTDLTKGITETTEYLERFFRSLLLGEQWDLRNRYLHIQATEEWKEQPRLDKPSNAGQVQDKLGASTGKVINQFDTDNHNIQQIVLAVGEQQMSVKEMMEALSLKGRDNFLKVYLNPAIEGQYIRLLYPNSPRHPRQKYLLTVKGMALYNEICKNNIR